LVIPQEEICITCDKDKILQVINNLLNNAIKFSNKNGVINISASVLPDKSVEFKIQDFGIGIPDDKIEKIFERFYQIDSSSTRSYSGLGLGLSICKNIIELHSGIITVKSSLNKGSIFSFILPPVAHIEINNEKIISTDESQKKNGKHFFKSGLKRKSVLIIDDDNEILDFIEILLENENFNVIKCPNPKESFSILKNQEIDIILLDISMKDMSGIDVCKKIKSSESTKNIPVLIITARAENSVRQICFDSGANDILTKPFSNKELIKKIFDLLIKG